MHLTDEQFEDVLAGGARPEHLGQCPACRDRLEELQALRGRLKSAFAPIHASEGLARRVREKLASAAQRSPQLPVVHAASAPAAEVKPAKVRDPARRARRIRRLEWSALAAGAAVALSIGVALYLHPPETASAAPAELVSLHQHNLSPHRQFFTDADPAKLAEYLKTQVGFTPAVPKLGAGMSMRGCCVAHFRGQAVGSYVVETPKGFISIIVVRQQPQSLGMKRQFEHNGSAYWSDSFEQANLVALRLGDYTYCAVGQVPHDLLAELLGQLALDGQARQ